MCAICTNVTQILSLIFTQRNNQLVWDETSLIMLDMFNNTWGSRKEIVVDHCVDITLQVYLHLSTISQIALIEFRDCAVCYQCRRYHYHARGF